MTELAAGCHTIHWSPVFGGRPDLPAIVHAAADAGFELIGLDLGTVDAYLTAGGSLSELAGILRDTGLAVTDVVALSLQPDRDPEDLAARLAGVIRAVEAPLCVGAVAAPGDVRRAVDGFRAGLGPIASAGARLAVEFGGYMGLRTLDEAVAVCEQLGWDRAGVLLDSYQCARAGTPIDAIRALERDQIALVQFADASGPSPSGEALVTESRHHRLLPGDGELPLRAFLDAVVGVGYAGPLVAEVLSDKLRRSDPSEAAPAMFRALTRHAAAGSPP